MSEIIKKIDQLQDPRSTNASLKINNDIVEGRVLWEKGITAGVTKEIKSFS